MQNLTVLVAPATGTTRRIEITVDETIGLNAGKDVYSVARGMAKKIINQVNPFSWAWAKVFVDDKIISIKRENEKFVHEIQVVI
jgi:hypothetical protein